jgi:DNA-binding winged helix-turn-helix (wHTH) protein
MEALASSEVFLFDDFRLDRRGGGLFRRDDNSTFVPVAVGSRGLDILGVLIARAGEVVSKDEIIAAVWPGTVVEDSNLTVQISALRRVLDRDRIHESCIQTVSGRGYRFAGAVVQPGLEERSAPLPPNGSGGATPLPIDANTDRRLSRPFLGTAGSTRRLDPPARRDPGAGCRRLFPVDGSRRGRHARTAEVPPPAIGRTED